MTITQFEMSFIVFLCYAYFQFPSEKDIYGGLLRVSAMVSGTGWNKRLRLRPLSTRLRRQLGCWSVSACRRGMRERPRSLVVLEDQWCLLLSQGSLCQRPSQQDISIRTPYFSRYSNQPCVPQCSFRTVVIWHTFRTWFLQCISRARFFQWLF